MEAIIYVTLYYGLRRSEALGLRWQSVNFETNTITREHTVVKNLSVEYKDKTKSKTSMRTFPLLADVKALLLKLKDRQNENRRIFGDTYIESDYIFKWRDGKLYRPDYITQTFIKVLNKNGFRKMRYHDLRHSTASILYDMGWSLKDIQEWLGHGEHKNAQLKNVRILAAVLFSLQEMKKHFFKSKPIIFFTEQKYFLISLDKYHNLWYNKI